MGERGILGAAVASSVYALLALSLLLVPIAEAVGSPHTPLTAAAWTRHSARDSYRPAHFLHMPRSHQRHGAAPRARAAVVGGKLVSIEQVPWQVAVFAEFEIEGFKAKILCGGSIIDLSHVVTAGHCGIDPFTEKPLAPSSFHVFAGASTITAKELKEGATAQERPVAAVRIHPYFEYASSEGADDVAVLQLAEPLKATAAVKPIALNLVQQITSDPERLDTIRADPSNSLLSLNAAPTLATRWLTPRLRDFLPGGVPGHAEQLVKVRARPAMISSSHDRHLPFRLARLHVICL